MAVAVVVVWAAVERTAVVFVSLPYLLLVLLLLVWA